MKGGPPWLQTPSWIPEVSHRVAAAWGSRIVCLGPAPASLKGSPEAAVSQEPGQQWSRQPAPELIVPFAPLLCLATSLLTVGPVCLSVQAGRREVTEGTGAGLVWLPGCPPQGYDSNPSKGLPPASLWGLLPAVSLIGCKHLEDSGKL